MSLLSSILTILIFAGVIIFFWLLATLLFLLYGWIEKKMLKKRIPNKCKEETENVRHRREQVREGHRIRISRDSNPDSEKSTGTEGNSTASIKSEGIQSISDEDINEPGRNSNIDDDRNSESETRNESNGRTSGWKRI